MFRLTAIRYMLGALTLAGAVILGSAFHLPARAAEAYAHAVHPNSTCSSAGPCLYWENKSTGPGLQGDGLKGVGVVGRTLAPSKGVGVFGEDIATRSDGTNDGVEGAAGAGTGVLGMSKTGVAVSAIAQANYGVQALMLHKTAAGSSAAAVGAFDDSNDAGSVNFGVNGYSLYGTGVLGESSNYIAINAVGGASTPSGSWPTLSITGGPNGLIADPIDACENYADDPCTSSSPSRLLRLDPTGNLTIAGQLFTAGSCSIGCSGPRGGVTHRVISYAPSQTEPSIEDFGEAQLVDGRSEIALRADFANVIDRQVTYLVFITPEGDCNVLYVARKTSTGFEVRESHGGRSSLTFDYRIVAKPLGTVHPRLPMMTLGPRVAAAPLPALRMP